MVTTFSQDFFQELPYEQLIEVDGGVDWYSIGMGLSMTAGGIIGGVIGSSVGPAGTVGGVKAGTAAGTLIGSAIGGILYSL